MTEALASRVAGLKLGGIVGILLLPMVVLSYLMIGALKSDMRHAERELIGIEFTRLIMPVTVAAANTSLNGEDVAALRRDGKALAELLGVNNQFSIALASLITYGKDPRFAVSSLERLQHDVATASNIIHDPFAETYFLGAISVQNGAAVLGDFAQLQTLKSRTLRDGTISSDEAAKLLLSVGAWQESQNRLTESLAEARDASSDPESYAPAFAVAKEMAAHPRRVAAMLSKSAEAMAQEMQLAAEFNAETSRIVEHAGKLWAFSVDTFASRLHERLTAMRFRLYLLLGIAAAACLIGVGGAALMFRSTLKQLDDVKLMRDRAEDARAAALQSAEDVRRINDDMARLNGDLARNLAMLREAQDENLRRGKMAQLGQLTATVAHELRNPLGAVRTSAFLLARKVKDKGLGIEPQLERINNGITRCDNIISQLLDFARSKAIQPERVDFDEWLARLIEEEAANLPPSLAIECHLGIGGDAAIDPARMSRAICNILSNASEALVGKGDESAKLSVLNPTIVISSAVTARGFEVSVADNGPGIAPEHMEKILEPLFTTKNFGTGLGLPAVQKIMEQHGGGLDVESQPGKGARFTLWWPAEEKLKEAS